MVAGLKALGILTETTTGLKLRTAGYAVRDLLNALAERDAIPTLLTPAETAAKSKQRPAPNPPDGTMPEYTCFNCGREILNPDTFVGDPDGRHEPVCDEACALLSAVPE